jgi:hypothetical protein
MKISLIEQVNPIDSNPFYYKCSSVDTSTKTWTGYRITWNNSTKTWNVSSELTKGLSYYDNVPNIDEVYNVNVTSLIFLSPF